MLRSCAARPGERHGGVVRTVEDEGGDGDLVRPVGVAGAQPSTSNQVVMESRSWIGIMLYFTSRGPGPAVEWRPFRWSRLP